MLSALTGKMRCGGRCINHYFCPLVRLLALGTLIAATGCASTPDQKQTKKDKKDVAQMRIFREANDFTGQAAEAGSLGVTMAKVGRADPMEFQVLKDPVLDERDLKKAELVEEAHGGFSIGIEFTRHGTMVLEMNSLAVQGGHLLVAGRWSDGTNVLGRFIAAPLIRRRLDKGIIAFTPDMNRDEATRFVRGLNNVAIKLENQAKPAREKKEKEDKKQEKTLKAKKEVPKSYYKRDFDPFLAQ